MSYNLHDFKPGDTLYASQLVEMDEQIFQNESNISDLSKQINLISETGIPKLMVYPLSVIADTDGQTVFDIELDTFDINTDTVLVQSGRTMLFPNQDFTVTENTIVLNEGVLSGRTIGIYIFKNVPIGEEGSVSGSTLADGSIPLSKLGEEVALKSELAELTASDLGAFGFNGQILANADLNNYIYNGAYFALGSHASSVKNAPVSTAFHLHVLRADNADSVARVIQILTETAITRVNLYFRKHTDAGWSAWKDLANAEDFLPLTGGTINGLLNLFLQDGTLRFSLPNSETVVHLIQYGDRGYFRVFKDSANYSDIVIGFPDGPRHAGIKNGNAFSYLFYGEHNKPKGTYVGNGDATRRIIETGGIGNYLAIHGNSHSIIATPNGGIVIYYSDGNITGIPSSKMSYFGGTLTIVGTGAEYNMNGVTYTYQVL